jgi:hypothetical protein
MTLERKNEGRQYDYSMLIRILLHDEMSFLRIGFKGFKTVYPIQELEKILLIRNWNQRTSKINYDSIFIEVML